MRKKEARALFRAKRAAITDAEANRWNDLLLISFQQAGLPFVAKVLSYYPSGEKGEVDTFLLTRYLAFSNPGVAIAFPRITTDFGIDAIVPDSEEDFVPNAYDILEPATGLKLEPEEVDLVLVPLLAYDLQGNRAGYGKGYYDRFLAACRPDCLKVGLSYFEPVSLLEDTHEFDIPLDLCITPSKVYVF
ncbi:5-formyltetrahydrofolate cyclo-ligase [Cnuella takakiae]|uniref:5-formyltetrahydrofolate cyclo-ligase n=1 Tax=Cnuella takakiae TaxID=1302690 RepID=A0A1M4XRJ8_9BACT|nr:5-formyltetrahydrofolate cyclo-ligase [Cnuella takakiae]OLY92916.1 5-formyltetrahydrofolate cyclo-ligase [Cnuella takakiae]SHE96075.1 5-formyltetrahydrofolate cyclo-ligase [Cnuella takakiae]